MKRTSEEILTETRGLLMDALIEGLQEGEEPGAVRRLCKRQFELMESHKRAVVRAKDAEKKLERAYERMTTIEKQRDLFGDRHARVMAIIKGWKVDDVITPEDVRRINAINSGEEQS